MSLDKNIDIGIVLLPNKECTEFSNSISQTVSQKLPNLTKLPNNPHITIIHIANQSLQDQLTLKKEFELLAPHDMEQIIEDSLAQNYNFNNQEHYVHKGGLKTNNNWIEINKYQFGNYEYLKTESDLQKYLKEYAVAEEDSLIDSAIVSSKSIKYFKFNSIFKKNKT